MSSREISFSLNKHHKTLEGKPILKVYSVFVLIIAKAADVIQQSVVGDADMWKQNVLTWTTLQGELQDRQQRGQKRKREEDEILNVDAASTNSMNSIQLVMDPPSFRVSCRCSGIIARSYTSQVCVWAFNVFLKWKMSILFYILNVYYYKKCHGIL